MALLATGISIDIARIPPEVTIPTLDADNAEALALRALAFVAGDEERLHLGVRDQLGHGCVTALLDGVGGRLEGGDARPDRAGASD